MDGYIKTLPISGWTFWLWEQYWILWVDNFRFSFYEIRVQNQWGIKFWNTGEDFDTLGPSLITARMEYLLAFQYLYCELCVENQWGRGKKHCFSSWNFIRSNKHDTFWHVVTTGYFFVFFMNNCFFRIFSLGNLQKPRLSLV